MTATIGDISARRERRTAPVGLLRAVVRTAPASPADDVVVSVASQDGATRRRARWAPAGGRAPAVGDTGWIQRDDQGAWVLLGYATGEDLTVGRYSYTINGDGTTFAFARSVLRPPCAPPAVTDDAGNFVEVAARWTPGTLLLTFGEAPDAGDDFTVRYIA